MARYRTYTVEFKRQVVEEHLGGGTSLSQLARRHDISRELLRIWVKKYEAGDLACGRPATPDRRVYEAKVAGLERKGFIRRKSSKVSARAIDATVTAAGKTVYAEAVRMIRNVDDILSKEFSATELDQLDEYACDCGHGFVLITVSEHREASAGVVLPLPQRRHRRTRRAA